MKIENLIFLGAGASNAEGASLQTKLINDFFITHTNPNNLKIREIKFRLQNFFNNFFGLDFNLNDLRYCKLPTFEEALGLLEIAIQRNEEFRYFNKIQEIRDDFNSLIALTIDEKLKSPSIYHKKLLKRLHKENQLLKTAFISLNYDIIIDNGLTELYPTYDLDYGINFINYEEADEAEKNGLLDKEKHWTRPNPSKSIKLFKLHGSLNWLYCPVCLNIRLTPKEKSVPRIIIFPENCKICSGLLTHTIIPPSYFKVMSNYYLRQVWYETEQNLRNIKKIYFCGYSFPDADIHIKYLLKRIELFPQDKPEIYIINWHNRKKIRNARLEKNRYFRFFKDKDKIHYKKLSFQDFCEISAEIVNDF